MTDATSLSADLVLEGGGVKGIGLVGATVELVEAGYHFERIAGSSAGSIVAACLAALERAGEPLSRLEDIARSIDYAKFRDRGPVRRFFRFLGPVVDGFGIAFNNGIFAGSYLHQWLSGTLGDLGVRTFGDLRRDDPGSALPTDQEYRLVVTASDVSRQRLVRLPWDYSAYGLDPDEQPVADAVRASASIPFFFEPVTLRARNGAVSTLVDGGMLSNFPVALFDRTDGAPPRWPTFGVRLSARASAQATPPVTGPISMTLSVVETMTAACDARHIDDPCVQARSVFVETSGVSPVDFGITREQQEQLLAHGRAAAREFLADWSFERWCTQCAGLSGAEPAPAR
jgi:NTE family protein